jgi:hypothetical protein
MSTTRPYSVLVLLLAACDREAPIAPSLELVNEAERLDATMVNAHVYGTFALTFGDPGGVITSGPANFPGNPPGGPGTCEDGLWINSRGKPTAGSLDHPHPHCVRSSSTIKVVLEPISAAIRDPNRACAMGTACDFLYFSLAKGTPVTGVQSLVAKDGGPLGTDGFGTIFAYAIDAVTLGGSNTRVGVIKFTLEEYDDPAANLFAECSLDAGVFGCLRKVITASYTPLAVGGIGSPTLVTGFLWWAPATSPYNY